MNKENWIIDQLINQHIFNFFIAPGSRSSPLVIAATEQQKAQLHTHYDERGLGFLALGCAKATRQPAVLIVTSGTALGNLLPSIMEAHHSCTPLIVLSADRPSELRDCGANQTTEQPQIFRSFVRWQIDLPLSGSESYFRSCINQSYFYACQNPPGPVHLNCPFSEPLHLRFPSSKGSPFPIHFPKLICPPLTVPYSKGLILIGRLPDPNALSSILELAEKLSWPICADILSNARCYPTALQINYLDWKEKPTPEFVLHFGERLTSKKTADWLQKIKPPYLHVSPWLQLQDPTRILTERVQSDIAEFCRTFEAQKDPNWIANWRTQEPIFKETGAFTEVHAMRWLNDQIPPGFAIFLGNGMPIRNADQFLFPTFCREFFANRGLSGIDGNIATMAGLAENSPVFGIIGDQAALHDLNSLPLLKKTKHPVILLISNNFGGGIFHHLPISQSSHFESLWAAAHSFRFESAAKMYDIPYFDFEHLEAVFQSGQSAIVELITDRAANYAYTQ